MTTTATFVRNIIGWRGDAKLYRVAPPVSYGYDSDADGAEGTTDHVIVSAARVPFSGPETYIFAADAAGKVINWAEMPGSFRGDLDHEAALKGAGWVVA